MSRSLDKAVIARLKSEDPQPAYRDISSLFSDHNNADEPLLEIEFLGTSHPLEHGVSYLRDGPAIAIPKLRLAQAFVAGRQILQDHLLLVRGSRRGSDDQAPVPAHVLAATSVLLLMDPEHLTAANTRKRSLRNTLTALRGRGLCEEDDDLKQSRSQRRDMAVRTEKYFVDSLLTSRLHRHTKSPTLWNHRRWLLELCRDQNIELIGATLADGDDLTRIVMVSGERHPRNYYAWNHARWLWLSTEWQGSSTTEGSAKGRRTSSRDDQQQQQQQLCRSIKDWCLKHHRDISGWAFLGFAMGQTADANEKASICNETARDVLGITESFRWTNESVWVFLRGLLAARLLDGDNARLFQALHAKLVPSVPCHGLVGSTP
ncbi:protein prenyltransferase alpha subunit repeat containing protein 1 [Microdochium nivale]|nr:protein prenyltransferase alpha subunit repeat containing protein 1 [Microdochium nivale]